MARLLWVDPSWAVSSLPILWLLHMFLGELVPNTQSWVEAAVARKAFICDPKIYHFKKVNISDGKHGASTGVLSCTEKQ